MKEEKSYSPISGYIALIIILGMVGFPIYMMVLEQFWWAIMLGFGLFFCAGLMVVNPNESMVMVLFGAYKGTVKKNGFNLCWRHQLFPKIKKLLPLKIEPEEIEKLRIKK